MKLYAFIAILVISAAGGASYFYDHLSANRRSRRERRKQLAELETLPPVKADCSTPEGAVLRLEDCFAKQDFNGAAACRDFATEARLWLEERGHLTPDVKAQMLPETIQSVEKYFRDALAKNWTPDAGRARIYFPKREASRSGMVVITKTTHRPDGSLISQRVLTVESQNGWRVVRTLPNLPQNAS